MNLTITIGTTVVCIVITWYVTRHYFRKSLTQQPEWAKPFDARLKKLVEIHENPKVSGASASPEEKAATVVRIDAAREGGVDTGIRVTAGETVTFFARGLISYDDGRHFATPEGVLCNKYGLPLFFPDSKGRGAPAIFPHENAYRTDGGATGRVGSLIGWIGAYTEQHAFFVGSKRELDAPATGPLFLAVNDARGTYGDNNGEFSVEIRLATSKKTDPQK